jgi:hypothetical protein
MAMLLFAAAVAAVTPAAPQEEPEGGAGRKQRRAARDEVFKMVDAYIVSNLQEGLGLGDDAFVKVLPLVKRLQSDRRSFAQRRHRALGELRRTLESGAATEARVAALLAEIKGVEVEEPAALRRDMEAIDAALDPVQQAKFRVLEAEVERRIRELASRMRRERQDDRQRRAPENRP